MGRSGTTARERWLLTANLVSIELLQRAACGWVLFSRNHLINSGKIGIWWSFDWQPVNLKRSSLERGCQYPTVGLSTPAGLLQLSIILTMPTKGVITQSPSRRQSCSITVSLNERTNYESDTTGIQRVWTCLHSEDLLKTGRFFNNEEKPDSNLQRINKDSCSVMFSCRIPVFAKHIGEHMEPQYVLSHTKTKYESRQ